MQILKSVIFCFMISALNYSCGQTSKSQETLEANNSITLNGKTYTPKEGVTISKTKPHKLPEQQVVFHKIHDTQRNITLGYLPLPNDWKLKNKADEERAFIFGPNNVRGFLPLINSFVYSQLPGYNQMMSQSGFQIKPLKTPEQLVKEELVPAFSKEGITLFKQYRVPELKKYDENYDQFVFRAVPMQKSFDVLATEWGDKDGNRLLFIIRQYIGYTQESCNWGYIVDMMDAPKAYFETAKKNYLYSLANRKYNPQWLHACYMEEAQKAAQRGKLHQQRMAALRAEGQAIIERGKAHSAMVDRNHKRFMDAHLERQTVSTSGTNYQVDAGSNVYWINSNGEYIPTNDYNFNPNNDENLNNQSWTKATINN